MLGLQELEVITPNTVSMLEAARLQTDSDEYIKSYHMVA